MIGRGGGLLPRREGGSARCWPTRSRSRLEAAAVGSVKSVCLGGVGGMPGRWGREGGCCTDVQYTLKVKDINQSGMM